jgi:quinol monooxygenase YgiN
MFALVVRFDLRLGVEDAFDRLVAATVARIRDEEPGTLLYLCHHVREEPQARVFYELYADRAAFDAHEQQAHVRAFLDQRQAFMDGPVRVEFMDPVDGKGWPA